jgi:hypothetical protein
MEEDNSIEVVVQADFAENSRILTQRAEKTLWDNRIALVFESVLIVFMVFVVFLVGFEEVGLRIAFFVLIAIFVLNLSIYGLIKLNIHTQATKWTGTGEPITYRISTNGLRSSSTKLVWESPWSRFTKIIETESDLLFVVERNDFVPIPKRFILDQGTLVQLRRIVSSNATGTVELLS